MMNAVDNDINGVDSPRAPSGMPITQPFVGFGDSAQDHLLGESRSSSTDTSNDPNPDGPEMENGNEICHSPVSVYSDARAIGTPNSFVSDQYPTSPDLFYETEQRERLFSTSSSNYAYSPYSLREEDPIAPHPCTHDGGSTLNRQASLVMVEHFFGHMETDPFISKDDSPVLACDEDSSMPPYPSSFTAHFNASTEEAISSSQGEEFFAHFCAVDKPSALQLDGSPTTESNQTTNSNNNCNSGELQTVQSPVTNTTSTDSAYLQLPQCGQGTTSRQCSNLSDLVTDTIPTNSLDTQQMLQDCLDALPPSQPSYETLHLEAIREEVDQCTCNEVKSKDDESVRSSVQPPKKLCEVEDSDFNKPSSSKETDTTIARRERNNAACRLSRKRRKDKKVEMEKQVEVFTNENEELRERIKLLEVECKRVKQSILSVMTNNNTH